MAPVAVRTLACFLLLSTMFTPYAEADITYSDVVSAAGPCISYLNGNDASPSNECCSGVKNLNDKAQTTKDRKIACDCLKKAGNEIHGLLPQRVSSLAGDCHVKLPFKLSVDMDCSKFR